MGNALEIVPLGGLGEFGINCLALRYASSMIVIDAGLMFSDQDYLGVDIIIPNFSYIKEHKDDLLAVVLTHSHEDHIGALPFLLQIKDVPVYGTPYTLKVVERNLQESYAEGIQFLNAVNTGKTIEIGPFKIEFIGVSHSTIDCAALAITTPTGTIIHTGDYKFDETPVCGLPTDIKRLREYGKQGVLALFSDSTNIENPKRMGSERDVIPALENIFDHAESRIFVSCFASSIHRLQIVIDLAKQFGRHVFPIGRGILQSIELATEEGFLSFPENLLVTAQELKYLPPNEIVVLATGCQGEPMAAMSRIANQSHKKISLETGDTVILSARQIPGNEKSISRLINDCYRSKSTVIDSTTARIHVSGHGAKEDLRLMLEATSPKFFIPLHGEYRQLYRHKLFACQELGYSQNNVILMEDGNILELTENHAYISGEINAGYVNVNESNLALLDQLTIQERKRLAREGTLVVAIPIDRETGAMENDVEIKTSGYIQGKNKSHLEELKNITQKLIDEASSENKLDYFFLEEHVKAGLKRYIQKTQSVRPTILPLIIPV